MAKKLPAPPKPEPPKKADAESHTYNWRSRKNLQRGKKLRG